MISVILPVYNVEKYLPRCMESLFGQTYSDFEIILVDDGSPDGSGALCDSYCEQHPSVRVVHKTNGGLSTARNAGIEAASGDYILFLDSDDWIEPDTLEKLADGLSRFQDHCIAFGYHMDYALSGQTIEHGFPVKEAVSMPVQDAVMLMERQELFNTVWNKIYSARIIRDNSIRFRKGAEPGEDVLFNSLYFQHVRFFLILPDLLYHYMNQGETTNSTRYDPALPQKIEWFSQARETLYTSLGLTAPECRAMLDRCYYQYRLTSIYNAYHGGDRESASSRRELLRSIFQDEAIRRWVTAPHSGSDEPDSYQKIFQLLYRFRSPALADSVYSGLFFAKKNLKNLYSRFRQSALK